MAVNLFIVDFFHWFQEFGRDFNDFSKKPALTPLFKIAPIALNVPICAAISGGRPETLCCTFI